VTDYKPIGRYDSTATHTDRHHFELHERTYPVCIDYEQVAEVDLLHLSSVFDGLYGVSSIAGMTAEDAIVIGRGLQRWGESHGGLALGEGDAREITLRAPDERELTS
jgi:hypothetical protein